MPRCIAKRGNRRRAGNGGLSVRGTQVDANTRGSRIDTYVARSVRNQAGVPGRRDVGRHGHGVSAGRRCVEGERCGYPTHKSSGSTALSRKRCGIWTVMGDRLVDRIKTNVEVALCERGDG